VSLELERELTIETAKKNTDQSIEDARAETAAAKQEGPKL